MNISAIGQDSHAFEPMGSPKPLVLGGVTVPGCRGLEGNSDADVILHALVNAISGISGEIILGKITDEMCLTQGIRESRAYVARALETLGDARIVHVSISLECKEPKISPVAPQICAEIARILSLAREHVCLTATSGEGLRHSAAGKVLPRSSSVPPHWQNKNLQRNRNDGTRQDRRI
jgi:2-C-methyl-D-erythritol 2,4-cyclodiphosphate synthase